LDHFEESSKFFFPRLPTLFSSNNN